MYVYDYSKGESNWFMYSTVISAAVHTHSTLTQTLIFLKSTLNFTLRYLTKYIFLEGEQIYPSLQTYISPFSFTLNALNTKLKHAISCQIQI